MFNDPKNKAQISAYFGGKRGNLGFSNSNDLYTSRIYEDDSYWTGSFELQYQISSTSNFALTYDCYTGKRPPKNSKGIRQTHYTGDGYKYYGGPGRQMHLYNNGQTTLRFTSQHVTFGIGHIGNGVMNGQWFQNLIHDNFPGGDLPRFKNVSNESLLFQVGGGL